MRRVIEEAVSKNPRFKQTLGNVTFVANARIAWNDVQITFTNITTSGTRLSPDYFMCTQIGRAILAKVGDKDGQFIEWTRETDKTRLTPDAGVYYINVDFFDDQTRELGLTVQKYRWVEGKLKQALGSIVYFAPGIDVTTISMSDAVTSLPVQFTGFNQSLGAFAYLLNPTQTLVCTYISGPNTGQRLAPLTEYWYERPQSVSVASSTTGGNELISIPNPYISVSFTDQNGYELRQGIDYTFQGDQWITLSSLYPPGTTITANMIVKQNPYYTTGTMPENILQVNMTGTETLAPDQVFIHTPAGTFTNPIVNSDGTLTIPQLLTPGDWLRWEVRVNSGQQKAVAKKWELNSLTLVNPLSITYTKTGANGTTYPITAAQVATADDTELLGVKQTSAGVPQPFNSTIAPITATLIYDNVLTVTANNTFQAGDMVLLGATKERFLNGSVVKVLASGLSDTQFTANFTWDNYVNTTDTGTAWGQRKLILPGLRLAIGDNVVVGDQCAIIVSPTLTETYEVFGSKENLSFTLEVKANDMQTASDLSEMLKRELLIYSRTNTEADGLTIFEITRSFIGQARDLSATAPSYVFTVSVTASADWKVYVPLVTRLASLEIVGIPYASTKLHLNPRLAAFGNMVFIPAYC